MDEEIDPRRVNKVHLSKLLIKLMNRLRNETIDNKELRNCLILLVNLFSEDDFPDHYHEKGKNAQFLSKEERLVYKDILMNEFY